MYCLNCVGKVPNYKKACSALNVVRAYICFSLQATGMHGAFPSFPLLQLYLPELVNY